MQPDSRRVPGAHGLSLHLLEWSREGVPLLLLHGFGNDAHIWDHFAPVVAPHYRTLALDHRGHGDSDHDPEGRYDPDSFVADLESVTNHLGIERLVLLGHSMGGRVSIRFAGRHPDRMAGLVIVDVGPEVDLRGALKIRDDAARAPESFASVAEYEILLAGAYPMAKPDTIGRMAHHALRRREDGRLVQKMDPLFRQGMRQARESGSSPASEAASEAEALWSALKNISCPTLLVRGAASDVLSPETADRMVDEVLADGTLAVVAQAGHSVMVDNPEGFREAVGPFMLEDG